MLRFSIPFSLLLITACVPLETTDTPTRSNGSRAAAISISEKSCEGQSTGNCAFINGPVRLASKQINLPGHKLPFFETVENLDFIDSTSKNWAAPAATLTDGASIPAAFIQVIGDPTSREFINAATIHDAYCGSGNEEHAYYHAAPWPKVHRMFYDALRVGGTPKVKAKIMYAAVYLGGPRWSGSTQLPTSKSNNTISTKSTPRSPNKNLFQREIPTSVMVAEMRRVKSYIEASNPPIADLEHYLKAREIIIARIYKRTAYVHGDGHSTGSSTGPTTGP